MQHSFSHTCSLAPLFVSVLHLLFSLSFFNIYAKLKHCRQKSCQNFLVRNLFRLRNIRSGLALFSLKRYSIFAWFQSVSLVIQCIKCAVFLLDDWNANTIVIACIWLKISVIWNYFWCCAFVGTMYNIHATKIIMKSTK